MNKSVLKLLISQKAVKMKNYFIVGASSGIGRYIAESLSAAGHNVYGTYYSNDLIDHDTGTKYHYLNVLDKEHNLSFLPDSIDGLIYCPGSINLKPFTRIKPEDFIDDYNLQVVGAVKILQAVLSKLKASEQGSVLFFSTVAVQSGFNFHSQVSASKGAVEGLTRALAAELAPGIRVNCIAPSLTDTPLAASLLNNDARRAANSERHPLKRIGEVSDIGEMALFLLSDKSGWITGQIFGVDGGISVIKG